MKKSGIYKITCLANSKIYVGSAKDISARHRMHFKDLKSHKHKNRHLQNAYNLYGEDAFALEVIEWVDNLSDLLSREQYWLDFTKCYDRTIGFNVCMVAGSSLGVKRSDEFKEKIRQANLRRPEDVKKRNIEAVKKANIGKAPPNKGTKMWANKPHPRGGLGKKYPNRVMSQEHYDKVCEANRRPKSEEYFKKISEIRSKTYYFWTPEGCPVKIENLAQFCKRMGLNQGHMAQVGVGNEPHYKGWIIDPDCSPEIVEKWEKKYAAKKAA